ncbi:hypothetical protein BDQ17DRAFT_1105516 [Cyathus striatus]|nr:hypothetical protein BDQ17DRAFT_1105516 [Cyathus striatus]
MWNRKGHSIRTKPCQRSMTTPRSNKTETGTVQRCTIEPSKSCLSLDSESPTTSRTRHINGVHGCPLTSIDQAIAHRTHGVLETISSHNCQESKGTSIPSSRRQLRDTPAPIITKGGSPVSLLY